MRIFTLVLLGLAFMTNSLLASGPTSTPVKIDESTVNWVGKKVTGEHSGDIKLKSGELKFEKGLLTGGSFVIDMNTINTTDLKGGGAKKLNGHLMSADFFGVENHPTATLKIVSVVQNRSGDSKVTADLTIKGITKPVTFDATISENEASAKILVDRTKYDIKYGSGSFFEGLGDKMIYNDFELNIKLVY